MYSVTFVNDQTQLLLVAEEINLQRIRVCCSVHEAQILRNALVEDESADGGFDQSASFISVEEHSHLDLRMDADRTVLVSHQHFVEVCKYLAVALFRVGISFFYARVRQIVAAKDHILRRGRDRRSVLRRQNVVDGEHQESCFCLCFYGQRYVYRHLVTVEVSVEGRTS